MSAAYSETHPVLVPEVATLLLEERTHRGKKGKARDGADGWSYVAGAAT